MMNSFGSWAMTILGVVVIGIIIDLVLPTGRMQKYLKSVFAAILVLIIVLPIPSIIKNGINFDSGSLFENDFTLDDNYLDYSNSIKYSYLEKGVVSALAEDGIKNAKVTITGGSDKNIYKISLVKINLQNSVIDEDLQHINKYELVRDKVTAYLKVDKGLVIIDG